LTRDALLQGSRLQLQTNIFRTGLIITAGWFGFQLLSHLAEAPLRGSPVEMGRWFLVPAAGALAFGVLFSLAYWAILLPFRAWLIHRQNPLLYGEMTLVADRDGIELAGPRSTTRFSWPDLRGLKENNAVFVVCLSRSAGFYIPKRGMAQNDTEELGTLLRGNHRLL